MTLVRRSLITIGLLLFPALLDAQTKPSQDVWEPFRFFVGEWEGKGEGKPGISNTTREYRFVLNNRFIQVRNRSQYDPQPKNPKGETHEDWGMLSFDRGRKQFVLRQFHVEGFVNQLIMSSSTSDGKTFTFTSESIENIPTGWRARETYKLLSAHEFVEVFELADPAKILRCTLRTINAARNEYRSRGSQQSTALRNMEIGS